MEDIKLELKTDGLIINPKTQDETKHNFLYILQKKHSSLKYNLKCHEYMISTITAVWWIVMFVEVLVALVPALLSFLETAHENNSFKTPRLSLQSVSLFIIVTNIRVRISKKKEQHKVNARQIQNLIQDLELVFIKNNYTIDSLNNLICIYNDRIKTMRDDEENIPYFVKKMCL